MGRHQASTQTQRIDCVVVGFLVASSIAFHSGRIPMDVAFRSIAPGEELQFEFVAKDPGAYMVHCGTPPVLRDSEQFFLKLSAFSDRLHRWVDERPHLRPNVVGMTKRYLKEGLHDRAITRDINWGIPIPLEGYEDKRIYVWFDAVIGYLSASIEWAARFGTDPDQWRQWWCDPDAQGYYFMGKDNITFHSQIWPAELLGYDGRGSSGGRPGRFVTLELPTEVVSSEFLTMESKQFSSSRGVGIGLAAGIKVTPGLLIVYLVLTVLIGILLERKILGYMQLRPGPNRAGPWGALQSLADGVKLALKESITPKGVDWFVYFAAPAISAIPAFTAFAFIPMGPEVSIFGHWTPLQLTDVPVAVLFILGLSAIGVYGIVLAGWSSGSTYSLLGSLRSSAQVISYEVAMGLSLVAVFLYAGSLSTSEIVAGSFGRRASNSSATRGRPPVMSRVL